MIQVMYCDTLGEMSGDETRCRHTYMVFVGQMSSHLDGRGNTSVNVCFASYWPYSHPNGYEMVSLEGKCQMSFETLLNVSIVRTQTQRTVKATLALFLCDVGKKHGKICCKNNYSFYT